MEDEVAAFMVLLRFIQLCLQFCYFCLRLYPFYLRLCQLCLWAPPHPLQSNKLFTKTIKNVYLRNWLHLLEVTDLHLKGDLQWGDIQKR